MTLFELNNAEFKNRYAHRGLEPVPEIINSSALQEATKSSYSYVYFCSGGRLHCGEYFYDYTATSITVWSTCIAANNAEKGRNSDRWMRNPFLTPRRPIAGSLDASSCKVSSRVESIGLLKER
jgi:hypothetical protein